MFERQFEEWWEQYPLKVAKQAAKREFLKALKVADFGRLLEAVEVYRAAVEDWPESERQFIPHARRWLHDHRWLDDRSTWFKTSRRTVAAAYALLCEARRNHRQYTGQSGTVYKKPQALAELPPDVAEVAAECWEEMGGSKDPRAVFYRHWREE